MMGFIFLATLIILSVAVTALTIYRDAKRPVSTNLVNADCWRMFM